MITYPAVAVKSLRNTSESLTSPAALRRSAYARLRLQGFPLADQPAQ